MKAFLLICFFCFFGQVANAQFATYQSINEIEAAQRAPAQTVFGYLPTTNGWVRITIKIKETSNSILVVGYKKKELSNYGGAFANYGNSTQWYKCNSWAQEVNVYSDGREIAYNFDYKVSISGLGTVYF